MYENSNPPDYNKFNLSKNPFMVLSSEGIENVEDIHVSQNIDLKLAEMLSEVIEKNSSIAISLVGHLGTGKTQRLKGIKKLIDDSDGFAIFHKVDSNDVVRVTKGVFSHLPSDREKKEEEKGFFKSLKSIFSSSNSVKEDKWQLTEENYDPQLIAAKLHKELGTFPVSAILLDELENIITAPLSQLIQFFESLRAFISDMPFSCIFVFACTPEFYKVIKNKFPAFTIRLHAELECEKLSDEKAIELAKKRLEVVKLEEHINPIYPFDKAAITMANRLSKGNPRVLLRTLHGILASAARDPFIDIIDDRFVTTIIAAPSSLDEYILKVPEDLRKVVTSIIKNFDGGPVSYIQLAKKIKEPTTKTYANLEELVSMGLLRNKKGHYELLSSIKEMIESIKM
ncbi:MAG: ATPase [Candidatus Methanofastidiosia archaeon]